MSLAEASVGVLLLLGWLITDHYPPWSGFHSELPAALAGVVAVTIALRHGQSRVSAMAVALMAAALVPWLQWRFGLVPYAGDALLASLYLVGAGLCLWAGGSTDARRQAMLLRAIAVATLCGALLSTAVALYQWFGLTGLNQILAAEGLPGGRTGANLGQPNHVATLICMGLASLVLARHWARLRGAPAFVIALFLLIGLALTQSRVPWLGVLVLAAWMLLRRRALFAPLRLHPLALLALFVWYLLALWAAIHLPDLLFGGVAADPAGSRLGAGHRPTAWAQWVEALRLAPWFGYGWGQGHAAQAVGAMARPGVEFLPYAHNLVLDLLAWNGLPLGALMVLGLLLWYLRLGLRAEGPEQWFRFAVVSLIGAHALVEYPITYAYFLVPLALLAGQLEAQVGAGARWAMPRALLGALAFAWVLAWAAVVRDYFHAEGDIRVLREQAARIGGLRRTPAPDDLWVLDQLSAFSRTARIEPRPDMPAAELDQLIAMAKYFPSSLFLQQAALALSANGRVDEAHAAMRTLCAVSGDRYYQLALVRMAALVDEGLPASRTFVESLGLPKAVGTTPSMPHNPGPTCRAR